MSGQQVSQGLHGLTAFHFVALLKVCGGVGDADDVRKPVESWSACINRFQNQQIVIPSRCVEVWLAQMMSGQQVGQRSHDLNAAFYYWHHSTALLKVCKGEGGADDVQTAGVSGFARPD